MHLEVMKDIISHMNNCSNNFILKGETSLMIAYGLDRFSEDVDLDSIDTKFFLLYRLICKKISK